MNIFFGALLIIIGLSIFLGAMLFKFIFALILIVWGISLLTRKRRNWHQGRKTISKEDALNEVLLLSPFNRVIQADRFTGGKVVMILSGGELDLREAKTEAAEIDLEVSAILSGIAIRVPKAWKVVVQGTAILGEYASTAERGESVTLRIRGAAILGGVEIVN